MPAISTAGMMRDDAGWRDMEKVKLGLSQTRRLGRFYSILFFSTRVRDFFTRWMAILGTSELAKGRDAPFRVRPGVHPSWFNFSEEMRAKPGRSRSDSCRLYRSCLNLSLALFLSSVHTSEALLGCLAF